MDVIWIYYQKFVVLKNGICSKQRSHRGEARCFCLFAASLQNNQIHSQLAYKTAYWRTSGLPVLDLKLIRRKPNVRPHQNLIWGQIEFRQEAKYNLKYRSIPNSTSVAFQNILHFWTDVIQWDYYYMVHGTTSKWQDIKYMIRTSEQSKKRYARHQWSPRPW
jgi:hypothetical protein